MRAFGVGARLPQVAVCDYAVSKHGVSLSEPGVGVHDFVGIVFSCISDVQQPVTVFHSLPVVGLVQVQEEQFPQGFRVVGVFGQSRFLFPDGVRSLFLCCQHGRNARKQAQEDDG